MFGHKFEGRDQLRRTWRSFGVVSRKCLLPVAVRSAWFSAEVLVAVVVLVAPAVAVLVMRAMAGSVIF